MTQANAKPRYWMSAAPAACDICRQSIRSEFVDGRTAQGSWAIMCDHCHFLHGARGGRVLGTGIGQRYARQPDGRWLKTAG